jgi:signal transduction histidine kinase/ActR/RegA family two-component response regulator
MDTAPPSTASQFRLKRYFSIASGILMLGVVLPLAWAYYSSEVAEHIEIAGSRNEALAQTYANALWPEFGGFLLQPDLDAAARGAHPATRALDARIREMARDGVVLKIKVYNLSGTAVYSSVLREIGENKSSNPGFLAAREGRLINDLTHRGKMSITEGDIHNVDVVSTYIPIRLAGSGEVTAVFELYSNVTETVARIEKVTLKLLAVLIGVFLLLYLCLLAIVSHADRLLRRQYAELLASEERAAFASRAKSEFLSNMSHELRTPMNAILGFAQLLETEPDAPLSPNQGRFVRQILKAADHLLGLINQVLDLSRIEAGKLTLSLEPVDLDALLDDALPMVQHLMEQHTIARIDRGLDEACVVADYSRLKQVLLNLVSNAIKYNRPGGHVRIVSRRVGDRVRITVSDTGQGIEAARLGELFQPFNRLGVEASAVEGTGIGLALTKHLVEAMHGHIGVDSQPGIGSTFWLELPPVASDSRPPVSAAKPPPSPSASPLAADAKRVLYVEDNPANVLLMEELVRRLPGIELTSVHTAELGIAYARSHRPDLVVMDINLPGMDGIAALHALRAEPETSRIPVIALTASALESDIQRGLAAGFDGYFTKPIQIDAFTRTLLESLAGERRG